MCMKGYSDYSSAFSLDNNSFILYLPLLSREEAPATWNLQPQQARSNRHDQNNKTTTVHEYNQIQWNLDNQILVHNSVIVSS